MNGLGGLEHGAHEDLRNEGEAGLGRLLGRIAPDSFCSTYSSPTRDHKERGKSTFWRQEVQLYDRQQFETYLSMHITEHEPRCDHGREGATAAFCSVQSVDRVVDERLDQTSLCRRFHWGCTERRNNRGFVSLGKNALDCTANMQMDCSELAVTGGKEERKEKEKWGWGERNHA